MKNNNIIKDEIYIQSSIILPRKLSKQIMNQRNKIRGWKSKDSHDFKIQAPYE